MKREKTLEFELQRAMFYDLMEWRKVEKYEFGKFIVIWYVR